MVGKSTTALEDPLGQDWGRGQRSAQGRYEFYDYPPEVLAAREAERTQGPPIQWRKVLTHWGLIRADFIEKYHIHPTNRWLRSVPAHLFRDLLIGLLASDTATHRAVTADRITP